MYDTLQQQMKVMKQAAAAGLKGLKLRAGTMYLNGKPITVIDLSDIIVELEHENSAPSQIPTDYEDSDYGSDTCIESHAQLQARASRVGKFDKNGDCFWTAADEDAAWALMMDRASGL